MRRPAKKVAHIKGFYPSCHYVSILFSLSVISALARLAEKTC